MSDLLQDRYLLSSGYRALLYIKFNLSLKRIESSKKLKVPVFDIIDTQTYIATLSMISFFPVVSL